MFTFIGFILLLLVFTNPLNFTITLLLVSAYIIVCLVSGAFIPSLVGILILLVYYGAMIILISYVCAVVPNVLYESFSSLSSTIIGGILVIPNLLYVLTYSGATQLTPQVLVPLASYFYSLSGSYMFGLVFLFILYVMLFTSLYVIVSSPFRSA